MLGDDRMWSYPLQAVHRKHTLQRLVWRGKGCTISISIVIDFKGGEEPWIGIQADTCLEF